MCEAAAQPVRRGECHPVRHHQAEQRDRQQWAVHLCRHSRLQGTAEDRGRSSRRLDHPLFRAAQRDRRAERAARGARQHRGHAQCARAGQTVQDAHLRAEHDRCVWPGQPTQPDAQRDDPAAAHDLRRVEGARGADGRVLPSQVRAGLPLPTVSGCDLQRSTRRWHYR